MSKQRYRGKDECRRLNAGRVQKLDDLGFRWVKVTRLDQWEARFQELKEFRDAYGHVKVPRKHPGGLGMWTMGQSWKKASRHRDPGRTRKLEELGLKCHVDDGTEKPRTKKKPRTEKKPEEPPFQWDEAGGGPGQWGSDLPPLQAPDLPHLPPLPHPDLPREPRVSWVARNPERWEVRLRDLREFHEAHGHCDVPRKHSGGLGKWVNNQRCAGREKVGRLDPSRVERLEELGFQWTSNKRRQYSWEDRFKQLREFWEERGHCRVPQSHAGGLGNWVAQQRFKGARSRLEAGHVRQLEELGFQWGKATTSDEREEPLVQVKEPEPSTNEAAEAVQEGMTLDEREEPSGQLTEPEPSTNEAADAIQEEHGHYDVPQEHPEGMALDKREEPLGQLKEPEPSTNEAVEAVQEGHGHYDVPQRDTATNQRSSGEEESPRRDAGQTQKVKEPGFKSPTSKAAALWEARFRELEMFKEEHGHCNVSKGYAGGLGIWTKNQRSKKRSQKLDADRIERLEELGFQWEVTRMMHVRWDARLRELQEFVEVYGHCEVPQRHPGGLGKWVCPTCDLVRDVIITSANELDTKHYPGISA